MATDSVATAVRLDKWLWAARFFKTRALAKAAIQNGHAQYNQSKTKSSRTVEIGAELTIKQGYDEKTVVVIKLSGQRRNATEAALLYTETPQSIQQRQRRTDERKQLNAGRVITEGRPTKKQRRQIHRFKDESSGS